MKNKKYLFTGIIIFLLVAVISTTFAAFIVGNYDLDDSTNESQFAMGDVTEDGVSVVATLTDGHILFDAAENDHEGHVTVSGYKGDYNIEVKVVITGTTWTSVDIEVAFATGTQDTDNLVKLPDKISVLKSNAGNPTGDQNNIYTITKTLTFAWNERFEVDGQETNPSIWLDSEEAKSAYATPAAKLEALNNWKTAIESYKFVVNVHVNQEQ